MTSGATFSSLDTRDGILRTGYSLLPATSRASITRSAVGGGAAEQRKAVGRFLLRQRALLVRLVLDRAFDDLALARAAGAVLAAVRQADAGADRRGQHGFVRLAVEMVAAGLDSDLESHTILNMKNNTIQKFSRPRLLIVGCGDVGMRLLPLVRARFRVFAVTSSAGRCAELRAAGAIPIVADLDQPASLKRLARLAHARGPPGAAAVGRRARPAHPQPDRHST